MVTGIISGIVALLGITSTIVAWKLNPRLATYRELDQIYKDLEVDYAKRDKALAEGDSDTLTIITADIIRMRNRKAILLQRLG